MSTVTIVQRLASIAVLLAFSVWTDPLRAGEADDASLLAQLAARPARDAAIANGLRFLRGQVRVSERGRHTTAMASLALMAHAAAGITPADPEHGGWMRDLLVQVLDAQDELGYFGARDGSRMYGHGISTLMLAEMLGMVRDEALDERIRHALERATAVIVAAARVAKSGQHRGGWRYTPGDTSSDLSLSGWQLMSLHAVQQVGITVDEQVVAEAVRYAQRLTTADGRVGYERAGEDHPALRGLALWSFAIAPPPAAPPPTLTAAVATRIERQPIEFRGEWFYYRAYYDAVGLSRAAGEAWSRYAPHLERVLVQAQAADGSWRQPPGGNEGGHGPVYMTSLAVLSLAVQRHLLPVYQR